MVSLKPFRLRMELPPPLRVTVPVFGMTLLAPKRISPALTTVPPPQVPPVEVMSITPAPALVTELFAVPVTVACRSRSTSVPPLLFTVKVRLVPPRAKVPEIRAGLVQLPVEVTVTLPPRVSVPAPVVTWFTLPATPPVPPRLSAPMVSLNPLRLRIALPVLVALTVTAPVPGSTLDAPKVRVPKLTLVPPV